MSENVTIVNQKSSAIIFSFPSNHNKSYLCKLRHRKKVLKHFRIFISQDQHIRTLIWSAYYLFLKFLFKTQLCSYSKYDLNDNRNYEFVKKLRKIVIYVFRRNANDTRSLLKSRKPAKFRIFSLHHLKFRQRGG